MNQKFCLLFIKLIKPFGNLESNSWVFFGFGDVWFCWEAKRSETPQIHKHRAISTILPKGNFQKIQSAFGFGKFLAEESNVDIGRMIG